VATKRGRPLGAKSTKRIDIKRSDVDDPDADDTNRFFEFARGTSSDTWTNQTARPKEEALSSMQG